VSARPRGEIAARGQVMSRLGRSTRHRKRLGDRNCARCQTSACGFGRPPLLDPRCQPGSRRCRRHRDQAGSTRGQLGSRVRPNDKPENDRAVECRGVAAFRVGEPPRGSSGRPLSILCARLRLSRSSAQRARRSRSGRRRRRARRAAAGEYELIVVDETAGRDLAKHSPAAPIQALRVLRRNG